MAQQLEQPTVAARVVSALKPTRVRYSIVAMLFFATAVNYADRATLSIAGTSLAKDLDLDAVSMGFVFSAFGWAYVHRPAPRRLAARPVRLEEGLHRRACSPGRSSRSCRASSAWFTGRERGGGPVRAALPARHRGGALLPCQCPHRRGLVPDRRARHGLRHLQLRPVLRDGDLRAAHGLDHPLFGWQYVFFVMGGSASSSPSICDEAHLRPEGRTRRSTRQSSTTSSEGGALVDMDDEEAARPAASGPSWAQHQAAARQPHADRHLSRPVLHHHADLLLPHLVPRLPGAGARHVDPARPASSATLPALCGFFGGVLGRRHLRRHPAKRGFSLTVARKTPIVVGMLLSMA